MHLKYSPMYNYLTLELQWYSWLPWRYLVLYDLYFYVYQEANYSVLYNRGLPAATLSTDIYLPRNFFSDELSCDLQGFQGIFLSPSRGSQYTPLTRVSTESCSED